MITDDIKKLTFYVIVNSEGQFYRKMGYKGWVDKVSKARIYGKVGYARSVITHFSLYFPQNPIPDLYEIRVGEIIKLDETKRIAELTVKREKLAEKRAARQAQNTLEWAKQQLENAQKVYDKVISNTSQS